MRSSQRKHTHKSHTTRNHPEVGINRGPGGRHRGAAVGIGGTRGSEPEGLGVGGGRLFGQPGRGDDDDGNAADGNVGGGAAEPPPSYAELSQYFAPLESYVAASGLDEAGYLLQRARMLMIEAHASKPTRQTDVREYFDAWSDDLFRRTRRSYCRFFFCQVYRLSDFHAW